MSLVKKYHFLNFCTYANVIKANYSYITCLQQTSFRCAELDLTWLKPNKYGNFLEERDCARLQQFARLHEQRHAANPMANQPWVTVLRLGGPDPDNTHPAAVAAAQYVQQLWRQCPNVRTLEVTHLRPTDVAAIAAEGLLPVLTRLTVDRVLRESASCSS